ncbi:MAG: type II toxin-antitoxin system RelE/ParE family toxin [Rubellimicrobium sp.]|nr:type II toxin-antitoxin system RelE/ParE family toxin [Rubellimicrobium sp.]
MPRLVVLHGAEADLVEIGIYIARDNPTRASSFIDEIEARMAEIARRPHPPSLRGEAEATPTAHTRHRGCVVACGSSQ